MVCGKVRKGKIKTSITTEHYINTLKVGIVCFNMGSIRGHTTIYVEPHYTNQSYSLNVWMFPLGDVGIDNCEGCLVFIFGSVRIHFS